MSHHPHTSHHAAGAREFVKKSSLYQEFLAEREEILRHKWLESERLGYDIGFERALLDWIRKHRDSWRAARRAQQGVTQSPFAKHTRPEAEHAGGGDRHASSAPGTDGPH